MKRLFGLLLALVVMLACAGCGDNENKSPEKTAQPAKIGATIPIGMSEMDVKKWTENVAVAEGKPAGYVNPHTIVFFDDLNSMVAALKNKQIDRFGVCRNVGKYIVAHNDDLALIDKEHNPILGYSIAMSEKYASQIEEINAVIKVMKDDGTLDKLIKENITDLGDADPVPVALPVIEGAPTIKIAVTGDMPPLDYILANGTPAGFNVAFLGELGKRINKNFELVSIDAKARGAALSSGQVDALFWVIGVYDQEGNALPYPLDNVKGFAVSIPYLMDSRVGVTLK